MSKEFTKVQEVSVNWSGSKRTAMELCVGSLYSRLGSNSLTKVIESASILLQFGKIGSTFFDILVLGSCRNDLQIKGLCDRILDFCNNVKPYEFAMLLQGVFAREDTYTAEFNTSVMQVSGLIFSGYDIGYLVGINTSEKAVITTSQLVNPCDLMLVLLIHCKSRFKKVLLSSRNGDMVESINYSKKQQEKLKNWLSLPHIQELLLRLQKMPDTAVKRLANSYVDTAEIIYFGNVFNYVVEETSSYFADIYKVLGWKREETRLPESTRLQLYQVMTHRFFGLKGMLQSRNVYIPESGVVVKFNKTVDSIVSIMLREYHKEDTHFLYLYYSTSDGVHRFLPIDMTDIDGSYVHVLYEADVNALVLVLCFLGLGEPLRKTNKQLAALVREYASKSLSSEEFNNTLGYVPLKEMRTAIDSWVQEATTFVSDDNIFFETPVHWNYNSNSKKPSTSTHSTGYLVKEKIIHTYTRKLPPGQKASEEAKALARRIFMDLGDDKTIVGEFTRKVKVRVDHPLSSSVFS